jgi:predicted permease
MARRLSLVRGQSEGNVLQDYRLGFRMLVKYPGLTIAGGLALAVAIGIGAGWYDLWSKIMSPTMPVPEGERIVLVETHNVLTNAPERRVVRDFVEWRQQLRTIEDLGAYRTALRNLVAGNGVPAPIETAELTASAFRTARIAPLFGRGLLDSDESPGAPLVVVLGHDVWQRSFAGRQDVIGSVVRLGTIEATIVGVMPAGFTYPVNHDAWMPLKLRAAAGPLEGGAVTVIGRLASGATRVQADAELSLLGERTAREFPATHKHLRARVRGPVEDDEDDAEMSRLAQFASTNLPVLFVLTVACLNVGTLIYARTAMREGEIALRSALGAGRSRIVGQLFVETLVLASVAAAIGVVAADRILRWGVESAFASRGGVPFWLTPGLSLTAILYASGLAIVSAATLSILPALRATRARVQTHLANLGSAGATLRFGRFWTTAMIAQVALTTIAIPTAMDSASEWMRRIEIRRAFPSQEYLAARLEVERPFDDEDASAFEEGRARTLAELGRRLAQEPGVAAVTFADRAPGSTPRTRVAEVESSRGPDRMYDELFWTSSVGPDFFEVFDRSIVAGRDFHAGDRESTARTVIVNEAFVRRFARFTGDASPIGRRLRYADERVRPDESASEPWFEIVGVVRDLGLDPEDRELCCEEAPYIFHAAPANTVAPFVMLARVRGNPSAVVARLPAMAASVDAGVHVQEARPLSDWIHERELTAIVAIGAQAAITVLVLFLSTMAIFSLMSVSVSRQTREIGLRAALGAHPRQLLASVVTRALLLMGSGATAGSALLILAVIARGGSVAYYAGWLAITAVVMLLAGLLASLQPARRALRISPMAALREA